MKRFQTLMSLCRGCGNTRALMLALALGMPGLARADEAAEKKPVTVPFGLLKTQHMTVQVKINGKGPYRLIFDTGAPVTLINNKVAKEAGVFPKAFKQPVFAMSRTVAQLKLKSSGVREVRVA